MFYTILHVFHEVLHWILEFKRDCWFWYHPINVYDSYKKWFWVLKWDCCVGSWSKHWGQWMDKCSAQGIEKIITHWIEDNIKIGSYFFMPFHSCAVIKYQIAHCPKKNQIKNTIGRALIDMLMRKLESTSVRY